MKMTFCCNSIFKMIFALLRRKTKNSIQEDEIIIGREKMWMELGGVRARKGGIFTRIHNENLSLDRVIRQFPLEHSYFMSSVITNE